MRQIKALKGMLNGGTWLEPGDVAEVDDFRAAQLVELGHAVSVAEISIDLSDLVADASSFYNVTLEEAAAVVDSPAEAVPAQAVEPAQVVEQAAIMLAPPQVDEPAAEEPEPGQVVAGEPPSPQSRKPRRK